MIRTRLDNIELSDIQLISDLESLGRTNYAGSLRIAKLYALLSIAYQIQLRLSQTVPEGATETRVNRLTTKIIDSHITGIKRRIALVENINARKSRNQRSNKALAELAIAASASINNNNKQQQTFSLSETPPPTRAAIARPVMEALQELNKPSINEAYTDTIAELETLEASRTATKITDNLKVIDTGDKLGSAEEWLK